MFRHPVRTSVVSHPQDMAAEQSVLGGMLLSKDAIADVLERLRPGDFYRPAHQNVYDAILDLYGRGEPADAVTVAAELDRRGLLRRIGGAPYLHTLISTVPTAANAGFYAGIVAEKALLRRLVEAGTRVVQYGYAGAEGADVTEIVDRAQAEIYDVTEGRTSEDFVPLEDLLQPTMDEIDAIASNGGLARGVPTGFVELDEVTNGLHPGSDDHHRGPTWRREGAEARYAAADTDGLDDHGRRRSRGSAVRRGWASRRGWSRRRTSCSAGRAMRSSSPTGQSSSRMPRINGRPATGSGRPRNSVAVWTPLRRRVRWRGTRGAAPRR